MSELIEQLSKQLDREEGRIKHAYQDHLGFWTIGVGRLIDKRKGGGLSDDEIDYLLANDIKKREIEIKAKLLWFSKLNSARQGVLLSMAFQIGVDGLLNFKNTLKMVESGDYAGAAAGMLKSLWAKQTPARAKRMAKQMETGIWQ